MKEFFSLSTRRGVITLGVISSLVTTGVLKYSPFLLDWLGDSSVSLITRFVDDRMRKAALLEFTDYSYFIALFVLIATVVIWWELSSTLKKRLILKTGDEPIPPKPPVQDLSRGSKLALRAGTYTVWCYLLLAFIHLIGEVITMNAMVDFRHHMRILSPYFVEGQEKAIISRWSQIQSYSDYQRIYRDLESVAKANSIKLKPNHMY